jgi:transposase InsO family protein
VPFERWGIDFVGMLPETAKGNRYIITAIDYATRWVVCRAVPEATSEAVIDFLYDLMVDYGAPFEIISDRGKSFISKAVLSFMKKHKITKLTTSSYHPQTNGMVERMHGILGRTLTSLTNGNPLLWDLFLKQALFSLRVRRHAVTKYSPFYLVYGSHPRLPGDLSSPELGPVPLTEADIVARNTQTIMELGYHRKSAYEESLSQAERMKKNNEGAQGDYFFEIGDWVKRKNPSALKFEFKWTGPYMIAEYGHPGTYKIRKPSGEMHPAPINQRDLAPWLANTRDNVSFFYEPVLGPEFREDASDEDI